MREPGRSCPPLSGFTVAPARRDSGLAPGATLPAPIAVMVALLGLGMKAGGVGVLRRRLRGHTSEPRKATERTRPTTLRGPARVAGGNAVVPADDASAGARCYRFGGGGFIPQSLETKTQEP